MHSVDTYRRAVEIVRMVADQDCSGTTFGPTCLKSVVVKRRENPCLSCLAKLLVQDINADESGNLLDLLQDSLVQEGNSDAESDHGATHIRG